MAYGRAGVTGSGVAAGDHWAHKHRAADRTTVTTVSAAALGAVAADAAASDATRSDTPAAVVASLLGVCTWREPVLVASDHQEIGGKILTSGVLQDAPDASRGRGASTIVALSVVWPTAHKSVWSLRATAVPLFCSTELHRPRSSVQARCSTRTASAVSGTDAPIGQVKISVQPGVNP